MTTTRILFDGQPDGTAITTANTANLVGVNGVTAPTGFNTAKYDAAMSAHTLGNGANFTTVSGGNSAGCGVRVATPSAVNQQSASVVFTLPSTFAAEITLWTVRAVTLGVSGALHISNTGLYFYDKANVKTTIATAAQMAASLGVAHGLRVTMVLTSGSTTASNVQVKAYGPNGTTQIGTTMNVSNANLQAEAISGYDIGIVGNFMGYTIGVDDIQLADGTSTEFSNYSPPVNAAPTVTVSADQTVSTGSPVSVTGTAVDSDGTVASVGWAWNYYPPALGSAPALTGATTNTASFTPTVTGLYQLAYHAVDNLGASSDVALANVFVPGTSAIPISITENVGPWTGTSTNLVELSDNNASTYDESPAADTTLKRLRVRLSPLGIPATFSLNLKALISSTGTNTSQVRLVYNGTVLKTWSAFTPTTSESPFTFTLTSGEIAAIDTAAWNKLDVDLMYTGS